MFTSTIQRSIQLLAIGLLATSCAAAPKHLVQLRNVPEGSPQTLRIYHNDFSSLDLTYDSEIDKIEVQFEEEVVRITWDNSGEILLGVANDEIYALKFSGFTPGKIDLVGAGTDPRQWPEEHRVTLGKDPAIHLQHDGGVRYPEAEKDDGDGEEPKSSDGD